MSLKQISETEIQNYRDIMNCVQDSTNWKNKTRYVEVRTFDEAQRIATALNYFLGGSEISETVRLQKTLTGDKTISVYVVGSKGYYHYIGA